MADTIPSVQEEEKTAKATAGESSKIYPSGGSDSTISTVPEIDRIKNLSAAEAFREVCEELANLLVVYQNLGGKITGTALPEGREILAHRHILVLPARKTPDGSYSLDVPEAYQNGVPE